MGHNFTALLVVLAMISVVSWAVVVLTAFFRFAARARYRRRDKANSASEGGQA